MSQKPPESSEKTKQQAARREAQPAPARSFGTGLHPIFQLQRTLGNQRVAQLIKARRLTPEGRIIGLQPKLTVGAADDQYEQEADHVARQVVSMPDSAVLAFSPQTSPIEGDTSQAHTLQSKSLPLVASITPFVQRQMGTEEESEEDQNREEDNEEFLQAKFFNKSMALPLQRQTATEEKETEEIEPIQAKSAGSLSDSFEAGDDVESRLNQSKGRGIPLPGPVRAYMEPRFGADFSHVRVHTGSDSMQMNRDVGAQAFTYGSDIYYGASSSPTDLELTAHELTHVLQQTDLPPLQARKQEELSLKQACVQPLGLQRKLTVGTAEDQYAQGAGLSDGVPQSLIQRDMASQEKAPTLEAMALAPIVTPFIQGDTDDEESKQQESPIRAHLATQTSGDGFVSRTPRISSLIVQRDNPGDVTPPASTAAPSAETARQLAYQATILRNTREMSPDDRRALGGVIAGFPVYELLLQRNEKRQELESVHQATEDYQRRNEALSRGEELSAGVGASPELMGDLEERAARLSQEIEALTQRITPLLDELGTDEDGLTRHVTEDFPRIWLAQAGRIAEAMLSENEQAVLRERDRYHSNVCSEDTEGLLAVDRRLAGLQIERQDIQRRRDELDARVRSASEPLPGGVRDTADSMGPDRATLGRLDDQLRELDQRQRTERDSNGLAYPILLSANYTPGVLQSLSEGELERLLGTWTEGTLENIAATRANIADGTLKLWDLRDVPELTWVVLGLQAEGPLGRVIANHRERERSREEAVEIALVALAITAGVVAGIATAGGAFVVAAAATGIGAGVGLVQLGRDIHRFGAESAAGGVAVDPALADISQNEPQLLPILMDVIGLGLDVPGAVGVVRAVAQAERTMLAAGRAADFAAEIHRLVPVVAVANRIIQRASQSAEIAASVQAAALAVGKVARSTGNLRSAEAVLQLSARNNEFAELATRMLTQNRVTLASDAAIRARFPNPGQLNAALAELSDFISQPVTIEGWYSPQLNHMFVTAVEAPRMASVLVHEGVHFLQSANGRPLINFLAEFQAFAAQRDYLLEVVRVAGRRAVPVQHLWLIDSDLPAIAIEVSNRYRSAFPQYAAAYAIPPSFNPYNEVQDLARMVTQAITP